MATLDFSGFLSAVQSLIDSKMQSSQYSLVQDATITGKNGSSYTVTSGDNSYSAIPIDGTSEYPLNSLVCVLVTNNTKAGVVNYILGSKDAGTGKDYSYLLTKIVVELSGNVTNGSTDFTLTKEEHENILYLQNNNIDKIELEIKDDFKAYVREHGVLKIKAVFSTSFSPNEKGNVEYGLKFTLNFENSVTKTYKVSNFDMIGNPYEFSSSEQEIIFKIEEEYKQNFVDINKIVFYSDGLSQESSSIQMQNLSIFASEIQGLINDLKVNLKLASLESSFLGESNKVTLQAQLTNNSGGVFNFGKMRYFWFLKDATITHESEGFSNIAGAGWKCLNEKQPYTLDGVTYPNWIGTTDSLFELTEDMAPERNNFYRCYAIYDGNVSLSKHLVSNDIKIINYNKVEFILTLNADKYNFETLEDTITLSAEVTGTPQPKEGYVYDYEYKWVDNNDEFVGSSSIVVQPKDKTPIQTYSCEVKCYSKKNDEIDDDKTLLSTVTKEISLNNLVADGELVTETVYYWKDTTSAPSTPETDMVYDISSEDWNPDKEKNREQNKYRFKSTRQVLLTTYGDDGDKIWAGYEKDGNGEFYLHYNETVKIYYFSTNSEDSVSEIEKYSFNLEQMEKNPLDWSEPECDFIVGAYNSATAAAQLNIFNQLTANGTNDGIYYSENDPLGYQLTADTIVNPYKTYYTKEGNTYIIVEEPAGDPNAAGYYEYINKLYINATYIKSGTLLVEDSIGTIFKASVNEKVVTIGGWEVDSHNIFSRQNANSGYPKVGISSSGSYAFWAGVTQWSDGSPILSSAPFRVGFDGQLYATGADISGKITATSGYIGLDATGWQISSWYHPNSNTRTAIIKGNYKTADEGIEEDRAIQIVLRVPNAYGNGDTLADGETVAESRNEVLTVSNYYKKDGKLYSEYPFVLYSDGTFQATKSNITGTIVAKDGKIGDLEINDGGFKSSELTVYNGQLKATNIQGQEISAEILTLNEKNGSFKTPKISTYYFYDLNEEGYIKAGGSTALLDFTATISKVNNTSFKITLSNSKKLSRDQKFSVTLHRKNLIGFEGSSVTGTVIMNANNNSQTFNLTDVTYSSSNFVVDSFFTSTQPFYSCYFGENTTYNFQQLESDSPGFQVLGNFEPSNGNMWLLGADGKRWKGIYLNSSPVVSSDRNEKKNISTLLELEKYSNLFDKLNPVSYKFIHNDSDRIHIGFIAQEVEQSLLDVGLTTKDFAGICYWDKEDGTKGYGLRYEEFIALNTMEIQKLKAEIKELKDKLKEIKGE